MTRILVLVGSLRAASINRQIADVVGDVAAATGIGVTVFGASGPGLGDVPFYNEDIDTASGVGEVPAAVAALHAQAGRDD